MQTKLLQKTDFEKRNGKKLLFLYGHHGKFRGGKISPRFFLIRYDEKPRYQTDIKILSAHAFCFCIFRETKFTCSKKQLKTRKLLKYTSKVCSKTHTNIIRYKKKFISRNSIFLSTQTRSENPHSRHKTLLTLTDIQIITRYRRIPQNVA